MDAKSRFQHFISRMMGRVAASEKRWISQPLIAFIQKKFAISLDEAEKKEFVSLNDFFTRKLKANARPIAPSPAMVCPVDGLVTGFGQLEAATQMTVKNHPYTLDTLFGTHTELAQHFEGGHFATYYLAPHNYHRVHCPTTAELVTTIAIPGSLYTVDHRRKQMPKDVFAVNERVAAIFKVEKGWMAVIFVGATMVGSIHTVWSGQVVPPLGPLVDRHEFQPNQHCYQAGDEIGHFQFGSSVIILTSPSLCGEWHKGWSEDQACQMGQAIAQRL